MTDDRVTITDAARLLGVHHNTVRNRIRAGMYPSARLEDDGHGGQVWTLDRADLPALPPSETAETPAPAGPAPDAGEVVTRALAPLMVQLVSLTERLAEAQQERADAEVQARVAEHLADGLRSQVAELTRKLAEVQQPRHRWWHRGTTP
ncbi:MAG: helix-turn-helix domain-containing protein [Actinobacteria bacterium]|nr:helix-turn-helix domain-containing protein [Actinomycetota bacterium]